MEWISVYNCEPSKDGAYLMYDGVSIFTGQYGFFDGYSNDEGFIMDVTHWMPLPDPPEDE